MPDVFGLEAQGFVLFLGLLEKICMQPEAVIKQQDRSLIEGGLMVKMNSVSSGDLLSLYWTKFTSQALGSSRQ